MNLEELSPQLIQAHSKLIAEVEKQLKISALRMEGRSKQVAFSRFKNQTGRLRQSIAGRFGTIDGKPVAILQAGGAFGGKDLEYADDIEFGTRQIRPRLFLGRSVMKEREELAPKLNKLLKVVLMEK